MMRDPKRIPEVLSAIEKLWRTNPDLRLGQIIVNATKSAGRNVVSPEIYNIEDGDLLIGLDGLTPKSENENGA